MVTSIWSRIPANFFWVTGVRSARISEQGPDMSKDVWRFQECFEDFRRHFKHFSGPSFRLCFSKHNAVAGQEKSIIIYMDFSILALVGVNNFFKSVSVEALVPQIFQLGMRDWFIGFFDPQVWKLAGLPRATWKAALLYFLDIFVFCSLV